MLFAFILVIVIVVLAGTGLLLMERAGMLKPKKGGVSKDTELDESVPVEDLHEIIKRQYVTSPHNDTQVWARVDCVCGWATSGARQDYVKDQGDHHVRQSHSLIEQKREAARKVAEKLAENEKGDFAW